MLFREIRAALGARPPSPRLERAELALRHARMAVRVHR